MKLTYEQSEMLKGSKGEPIQIAMQMLSTIGEIYGADKLIPVKSAHCAGLSLKSHGIPGMEWAEEMAAKGAKMVIPTTMNVVGVDRSRDLGLPNEWVEPQMRIQKAYEAMGCIGTSSCVPYYFSVLPRFGEHIAWAESSAVVFTNSVIGARDNREGGPSAWAAGMTGFTPNYGFHLDENRTGDILFKLNVDLNNIADYGALGNYVGSIVGEKIPVFDKLGTPGIEDLVYFGAALASAGGVAMYHAIGITPEAPDLEAAFKGKKFEVVEIGDKELEQGYINLNSGKSREVDYVAIGCPHASLKQIKEIAEYLDGKKLNEKTALWVHTNIPIKNLAKEMGYMEKIENAGGILTQDLCTILGNPEDLGYKVLATNSPKMAFYAPGGNGLETWFGSVQKCLDAAITGHWND